MSFLITTILYNRDILHIICEYLDDKSFRHLTMTCKFLFNFKNIIKMEDIYTELALATRWSFRKIKVYDDRQLEIIIKLYGRQYDNITYIDIMNTTFLNIRLPKNVKKLTISVPWRKIFNAREFSYEKFKQMINAHIFLKKININTYSINKSTITINRENPKETYEKDIKYWLVQ